MSFLYRQGRSEVGGCPGQNFFRGPYLKNFSEQKIFRRATPTPPRRQKFFGQCTILEVKKFSGRVRCNRFPGTLSHFLCQISALSAKNRYLVLCPEIFNTQKRLGPNFNFSGGPSTSGPGAFCPPPPLPPPSRRPWYRPSS